MADRILIVEDNRTLNDMVSEILTLEGYECAQVFDGVEAKRSFDVIQPDAVVLDMNLPLVPGFEVLRHVKKHNPFTVVLILTGHGNEREAVQALKLGADAYFAKPVDRAELLEGLSRHLHRVRREREVERRSQWPGEVLDHWMGRVFLDAPAALIHVDPTGVIRVVNRAAARLLGKNAENLFGHQIGELVGQPVREQWVKVLHREAGTPKGYEGEVHVHRGDGEWFPALVSAVERPEKGHLLLCIRDLSSQKAMEKQFVESKRLASLGRVVEGVAHEVRNPLVSIGGFARKLHKISSDDSRERRYLDIILSEVDRLERMVKDIETYVSFARARPRGFSSVDLPEVMGVALENVRRRLEAAGNKENIEAVVECPGEPLSVFGDRGLLIELFEVLIENAYDAMPEGGRLTISLERSGDWVRVRVCDTGMGIDKSDLEEIFDPFFTSKTAGAGLGLAKAYMIVEDHSGHIQFESEVGNGAICNVSFPIERRSIIRQKA